MTYPDDDIDRRARRETVRSLWLLLILGGLALGAVSSMYVSSRHQRASLLADNRDLQTRLAFIEARHGEVLSLLARPQTELVKLTGAQEWSGQPLTVAYNPVQRAALVLIDRLPGPPGNATYQLRAITPAGTSTVLGPLDPAAPTEHLYFVPPALGDTFTFDVTLTSDREHHVVFDTHKT